MKNVSGVRRASQVFLWLAPFLSTILMLAYRAGGLKWFAAGGVVLSLLMAAAVWILAASSWRGAAEDCRATLLAGVFLVAGLAIPAVTVTTGPPPTSGAEWVSTLTEQHVRYTGLLMAGLVSWGGFTLLSARFRQAGEEVFSRLAFSAATMATVLFTLFVLSALTVYDLAATERSSGNHPDWVRPMGIMIASWLYLYAVLSYIATSLYAVALGKIGLLGKLGRTAFATISGIAAVLSVVAIRTANNTGTLTHGLFVLIIPAVPLILPYFLGVHLIRRAGDGNL